MAEAVGVASGGSQQWGVETIKESILNELSDAKGRSTFAYASEVTTAPNPGLLVEGVGIIGLPLGERDAEALISKCSQSPFGKGGDTVVDTKVRNSFELNPSQFSIRNPAWKACITALVDIVHRELTLKCVRQNVNAELYKILLYQKGAFFKSHQDSEKTPGMFGTLVVCLPSEHQGGNVILRHNKDEYQFDSAKSSGFDTAFAAWYSDVFHEVQKVTSGYRLVLTYNLVQRGSSILQKAPDGNGLRRLVECFQQYNQGLEAEEVTRHKFPSFLAYPLEYTYSQAGVRMSTLKGADFERVQVLKAATDKLGFDIYLALKEKVIHKDDDCGSEEFDREESFKYVLDLDGNPQTAIPDYDESHMLEDEIPTDDDQADESEHEGWTGNEGAPAQYWYRTSMVLIVPPASKVDFYLSAVKDSFEGLLKLLREYKARNPAHQSYGAQQLRRLCTLLIGRVHSSQDHRYGYSNYLRTDPDARALECMQEIAMIALEMGWYEMFINMGGKWKFGQSSLEALGKWLSGSHLEPVKTIKLKAMFEEQTDLQLQLKAYKHVGIGMTEADVAEDVEDEVRGIARDALRKNLESTTSLRKDASETLAVIVIQFGSEIDEYLLKKLKYCATPTRVAVILNYHADAAHDHAIFMKLLGHLWASDFTFECPEIRKPGARSWGTNQTHIVERDVVTTDELQRILDLSHSNHVMNPSHILSVMQAALPSISSDYARGNLLPFLSSFIKPEFFASFISDDATLNTAFATFATETFKAIITNYVGPEPPRTVNYSLTRGRCNCKDCNVVNDFLTSSTRTEHDFPCSKTRRQHLHQIFTDRPNAAYKVETIRIGNPHIWRITKTGAQTSMMQNAAWKEKVKFLRGKFGKLSKVKGGLLSEQALGGVMYRSIMGCTVESLTAAEKAVAPLGETSGNARKRKADDAVLGEGEGEGEGESDGGKRTRGPKWEGGVDIIDLT